MRPVSSYHSRPAPSYHPSPASTSFASLASSSFEHGGAGAAKSLIPWLKNLSSSLSASSSLGRVIHVGGSIKAPMTLPLSSPKRLSMLKNTEGKQPRAEKGVYSDKYV